MQMEETKSIVRRELNSEEVFSDWKGLIGVEEEVHNSFREILYETLDKNLKIELKYAMSLGYIKDQQEKYETIRKWFDDVFILELEDAEDPGQPRIETPLGDPHLQVGLFTVWGETEHDHKGVIEISISSEDKEAIVKRTLIEVLKMLLRTGSERFCESLREKLTEKFAGNIVNAFTCSIPRNYNRLSFRRSSNLRNRNPCGERGRARAWR